MGLSFVGTLQLKVYSALAFRGRRTDMRSVWSLISGISIPLGRRDNQFLPVPPVSVWCCGTGMDEGEIPLWVRWAPGQRDTDLFLPELRKPFCPDPSSLEQSQHGLQNTWGYFCELFWSIPPSPSYFQTDFLVLKTDI